MSIGHFPTPHPEELFYSVCARFQDRVQYPDKRFIGQELFGENVVAVVDLPARLGHFIASLPGGHDFTVDRIIEERTLFPFFRPFLPQQRVKRVRDGMEGSAITTVKMSSGSGGTRIRMPDWLRFCPACVKEDVRNFREPYWHRLHQVSGVVVCPVHLVFLEKSRARLRLRTNIYEFVSAEKAIDTIKARRLDLSNPTHQAFLNIARDASWLLSQRGLCSGYADLRRRYVHAFFEREIGTHGGMIDREKLADGLQKYYGPDFLRLLQCEIRKDTLSNWASVFVKDLSLNKVHHPLQHLLIIQFLGYTAESFFHMMAEYKPFGKGPWPCLNPVCDNYQKPVITKYDLSFSYSEHKRRPVGTFGCKCGFIYYRRGPDTSEEDKLRYDGITVHGPKWDTTLRDLWENSTLLLEEISLRLYGKRRLDYKIKVQAERLGLRFPRQIKTFRAAQEFKKRESPSVTPTTETEESGSTLLEKYRAEWIEALKQNPDAPRTRLKDKFSRVYKWLAKNDGEWLQSHLPPPKDHSFDWAGLDTRLADEVREAADCIRGYYIPMRITMYALGRHTDRYDYLRHFLDKLPLTAAILCEVVETRTDFAERLRQRIASDDQIGIVCQSSV
jgi:hypothetical protein